MRWSEVIVDMIRDRGKGCYYSANMVQWRNDDGSLYRIFERLDRCEYDVLVDGVKLERAIEMTLGAGECEDIGTDIFVCSKCGCTLDIEDAASCEPTMWVDGVAVCPRFCPNCGRKVKR